jgi:ubiquinone/menaquinone biosynthesis C-methylase UbiE
MKRVSEKKHWDDFWEASSELDDVYGTDDRIIENLARYVDLSGRSVLEVGAGTGRDIDKIACRHASAYALDYSEQSLLLMNKAVSDSVGVVCGDAFVLPFRGETFDVVFHQGLLEHFRNPGEMIDEHIRVLKKGGTLLIDVPQRYHYYTVLKHILIFFGKWFAGWETEFSVAQLRGLVESRGMEVLGVYGHNPSPSILYRGLRRVVLKTGIRLPMYPTMPRPIARLLRSIGSLLPSNLRINTAMVIGCIAKKK